MKNSLGFLVIIILTIYLYGCSNNNQSHDKTTSLKNYRRTDLHYKKKNLDSLLIANKTLHLDFYGELLGDKAFIDIMEHDSLYLEDVTAFLTKNHFTQDQAAVCLCVMQHLKPNNYVKFCKLMLSLYDKNKITSFNLIEYAIWSPPEFIEHHRIIVENYNNTQVINFLKSILSDNKVPNEVRKDIPDILSGKTKEDLENFD